MQPKITAIVVWLGLLGIGADVIWANCAAQEEDETVEVVSLAAIYPKLKRYPKLSAPPVHVPATEFGRVFIERDGERFLYRMSRGSDASKGQKLDDCLAYAIGFNGTDYWLALFPSSKKLPAPLRAEWLAIFPKSKLDSAVPLDVSKKVGVVYSSFEDLLVSFAFLEDFRDQIGATDFGLQAVESGLDKAGFPREVRRIDDTPLGYPAQHFDAPEENDWAYFYISDAALPRNWQFLVQVDGDEDFCLKGIRLEESRGIDMARGLGFVGMRINIGEFTINRKDDGTRIPIEQFDWSQYVGKDTVIVRCEK